jgi:hypothetical protein
MLDKVMLFTDCQLWDSKFGEFKPANPQGKAYKTEIAQTSCVPVRLARL